MMIECPINDWGCPYFENGDCSMNREDPTADPHEECDAFYDYDE